MKDKGCKKPTKEETMEQDRILSSISDPNVWTPEKETEWLKQSVKDIRRRFPPMKKPPHVALQGGRRGG